MPASATNAGNGVTIDWKQIVRLWPRVVAGGLGAILLAAMYLQVADPVYEASVRMVVRNVGLGFDDVSGTQKHYDREFLSTQAEVIRSPATLARSLELVPPPPAAPGSSSDPVAKIADQLRVNPLANTDILRVTYQDADPQQAAARLQSIVESYREQVHETEQILAEKSAEVLSEREAELARQLAELEQQLADAERPLGAGAEGRERTDSPLIKELTAQWVTIQAQVAGIESQLDSNDAAEVPLLGEHLSNEAGREYANMQRDLAQATSDAQALEQTYRETHPALRAARQRVTTLQAALAAWRSEQLHGLRQELARLKQQEQHLKSMLDAEETRLAALQRARFDEERLTAEMERVGALHASTAAAVESLRLAHRSLAAGRGSISITVLDAFDVPETAIWPQPGPLLALAGLLGAGLAIALSLTIDHWSLLVPSLEDATSPTGANRDAKPSAEASLLDETQSLQKMTADAAAPVSPSQPSETTRSAQ